MTGRNIGGIIKVDPGGLVALYYMKKGKQYRKILFRVDGTTLLALDPVTKQEVKIGRALRPDPNVLVATIILTPHGETN